MGGPPVDTDSQHDREARAARNQSLFRALNEKLESINEVFAEALTERFRIACECTNLACVEMLEINSGDYQSVRDEPRQFLVLPGQVYPHVEKVARQVDGFVVGEKLGWAAYLAESFDQIV